MVLSPDITRSGNGNSGHSQWHILTTARVWSSLFSVFSG